MKVVYLYNNGNFFVGSTVGVALFLFFLTDFQVLLRRLKRVFLSIFEKL